MLAVATMAMRSRQVAEISDIGGFCTRAINSQFGETKPQKHEDPPSRRAGVPGSSGGVITVSATGSSPEIMIRVKRRFGA